MASYDARVGVITIARGRHDHLRAQIASLLLGSRPPDLHVLVSMDDATLAPVFRERPAAATAREVATIPVHTRLPLAAARNRGAERAFALGADVLVFLDVDCLAGPDLVTAYAGAVGDEPGTVWSGPVTYLAPAGPDGYDLHRLADLDDPHPARPTPEPGRRERGADPRLFWSLSFALGAEAWQRVGGFHEGYLGYGAEDTDFGRLVVDGGLDLGWVGDARAYHQHHPTADPPVQHLEDILRNGRLYRDRWGHWPMEGWLEAFESRGLVERRGDDWVRSTGRLDGV